MVMILKFEIPSSKLYWTNFAGKKIRWLYINYMLTFMVNKKRINRITDNIVATKGRSKSGILTSSHGGLESRYISPLVITVPLSGRLLNDSTSVKIFVLIKHDTHASLRWCILPIQVGPGRSRLIHHTPGDPHREVHPALHIQHHRLSHFNFLTIYQNLSIWRPLYTRGWFMTLKATLGIPTCNKFAIHMIFTRTQCEQKYWHYSDLNALTMCSLWRLLVEMFMYAFVSYYRDLDTSKTKHETNQSLSLTLFLNKTVNFVVRTETVPLYK